MLRLRSLKRGLAIQDRHRGSVKGDVSRVEPGSSVLHLRYDQEPLFPFPIFFYKKTLFPFLHIRELITQRKIPGKHSKRSHRRTEEGSTNHRRNREHAIKRNQYSSRNFFHRAIKP